MHSHCTSRLTIYLCYIDFFLHTFVFIEVLQFIHLRIPYNPMLFSFIFFFFLILLRKCPDDPKNHYQHSRNNLQLL